jgi:RNA methyltransferase, TrmH family
VITISSRQNPFVQRCRALARRRDATAGEVLLDGLHVLSDAVAAGVPILAAAATEEMWQSPAGAAVAGALEAQGAQLFAATAPVLDAASPVKAPTGLVAVGRWQPSGPDRIFAEAPALVVCAVHVQDPGNVGAIIRAAEAAGATGFAAADGSADPFGWKALRGSMGSAFRLPIAAAADARALCRTARERGVRVVATSPAEGTGLHEVDLRGPVMVLVGGEGAGLPEPLQALAHERLTIPMRPPVESLNVAVATGVILFEAYRQRQAGRSR